MPRLFGLSWVSFYRAATFLPTQVLRRFHVFILFQCRVPTLPLYFGIGWVVCRLAVNTLHMIRVRDRLARSVRTERTHGAYARSVRTEGTHGRAHMKHTTHGAYDSRSLRHTERTMHGAYKAGAYDAWSVQCTKRTTRGDYDAQSVGRTEIMTHGAYDARSV